MNRFQRDYVEVHRARICSALLIIGLTSIPLLSAQQPAPEAPVPSQIAATKKVFVSHGETDRPARRDGDIFSGGPDRAYNQFYSAIRSWGRYELVAAPADADLLFEIAFGDEPTGRLLTFGHLGRFVMRIKDPKTQTVLWSFSERVFPFNRQSTGDRNYDAALNYIVDDLKKLVARAG